MKLSCFKRFPFGQESDLIAEIRQARENYEEIRKEEKKEEVKKLTKCLLSKIKRDIVSYESCYLSYSDLHCDNDIARGVNQNLIHLGFNVQILQEYLISLRIRLPDLKQ